MIAISIVAKTKGVAYIVTQDGQLLDWGVKRFKGGLSLERILGYLLSLIYLGDIELVILPEFDEDKGTEASVFLGRLLDAINQRKLSRRFISKLDIDINFGELNRYAIAERLAAEHPPLKAYLPSEKKLWEAESADMVLFDAAALLSTARMI